MKRLRASLSFGLAGFVLGVLAGPSAEASIPRDLSRPAFSIKTAEDPFRAAPQLALPSLTQEMETSEARRVAASQCVALCELAAAIEARPFDRVALVPPNRTEGFTGHYWDNESSLYYAKARYYDPFTARFTQADSFLGSIDDPPSLHRYQYGNANPTMYVDADGHSATALGTAAGFMWGFGQMVGAGIDDLVTGRQRGTGAYLSMWAQNTIGGAEIGASIDIGLLSGGLAMSASGALGNAGLSALTVGGEGAGWGDFGREQVTQGAVGAALGPLVAKAVPFVGKALSMVPGAKTAGAWVAGKASQLAGSVAERFTVAESDVWITKSASEQISAFGSKGAMPRPTDPYSPNWSQYYTDNPNAMRFAPGAMRQGELAAGSTSSTFSVGRTHLSETEIGELLSRSDMKIANTTGVGAARAPRHHIFIQEQRAWFKARGIDIDKYTLELTQGEHSAAHTMGWNARVKEFIADEAFIGRPYSRREILKFGAELRREFGFGSIKAGPFER